MAKIKRTKMVLMEEMKWRRSTAINYHKKGFSLREIMEKMGYKSVSPVQNLLKNFKQK